MISEDQENLVDIVRRWSQPTTPEELKREGAQRLRRITLERMVVLLKKAVDRTLLEATIEGEEESPREFAENARRNFLNLFHEADSGAGSGDLERRAQSELEHLRRTLDERREAIEREEKHLAEGRPTDNAFDASFRQRLHGVFKGWSESARTLPALEHEVLALLRGELGSVREHAVRARIGEHRRVVDILERRIGKLCALMGETEEELARLSREEPGIASVYRSAQGIERDDEQRDRKMRLMRKIFIANVILREELGLADPRPLRELIAEEQRAQQEALPELPVTAIELPGPEEPKKDGRRRIVLGWRE